MSKDMLVLAIDIAEKAHVGQVDKADMPYILHPLRVMSIFSDKTEQICAVLHDVIEDTDVTLDILRDMGFSDEVITVLECLTKRDGENYDDFITRVLKNEIACRVKLADLFDNMNLERIASPSEKDRERIKKYETAVIRISEALEGNTKSIRTQLCGYENPRIAVSVFLSIEDDCLLIQGQDSGIVVEEVWGDSDYEYWYCFDKNSTEKLRKLLLKSDVKSNTYFVLVIQKEFSGVNGCALLREFCEANGIDYKFSNYI